LPARQKSSLPERVVTPAPYGDKNLGLYTVRGEVKDEVTALGGYIHSVLLRPDGLTNS
jgi:hypothetical protein